MYIKVKKGQFFLVAAGVIVTIIIGLGIIYNSAFLEETDSQTLLLAQELKYELAQIADNGLYKTSSTQDQINARSVDLVMNYSAANPDTNFFIIYGSNNSIRRAFYKNAIENSSFYSKVLDSPLPANETKVVLDAKTTYTFNKTRGQNIYVLVYREINGERYVSAA